MITLTEALKENRLEEFIQQQENSGVAPIYETDFNNLAKSVIKSSKSKDQT